MRKSISVAALVFDDPTTNAQVCEFDLSKMSPDEIAEQLVDYVNANLWIKAVELYYPVPKESTTNFCALMSKMRPEVQITGAIVCSADVTSSDCALFSSCSDGSSDSLIEAVFYGGDNLNASAICIQGWQPLGRVFTVTKADGAIIYELDGIPACDVYKKYLNVEGDENFFFNTLEFPLYALCNGVPVLRTPLSANADGSISLSSDFEVGTEMRISYGDPVTIIKCISNESRQLDDFAPEVMHIFSCVARKTYWSSKDPTYEISALAPIASSSGFFSHGEFMRANGGLVQHNVTMVISAMREGEMKTHANRVNITEKSFSNTKMSLASRLATFIGVTSAELQETNRKLLEAAIRDGLTGLYNRKSIQTQIENLINLGSEKLSLIMLDIDNFKTVNDTYGHNCGDEVIIALSKILRDTSSALKGNTSAGRWGGEEFMMLLYGDEAENAAKTAENIRKMFLETEYADTPRQTISVGVATHKKGESIDAICSRVDLALYAAKANGKNQVVVV